MLTATGANLIITADISAIGGFAAVVPTPGGGVPRHGPSGLVHGVAGRREDQAPAHAQERLPLHARLLGVTIS